MALTKITSWEEFDEALPIVEAREIAKARTTDKYLVKLQIKADGPVDAVNVANYLFVQSVEIPQHDGTPESRKARMLACEKSAKTEIENLLDNGEIEIYTEDDLAKQGVSYW